MRILGYSERGIVNALFYEIRYSQEPDLLLTDLLSGVRFPFADVALSSISGAEVIIEQSFSEFGMADGLLLLTTDKAAISVFVEAKVGAAWSIGAEFQAFKEGTQAKLSSSNLFTQLYHKVRLISGLRQGGIPTLQAGLGFPQSSTRAVRRIGSNPVVLRAVGKLAKHLDKTYYVALLPEKPEELERVFESLPGWSPPADFVDWDVSNYGYLSWSHVDSFCADNDLIDTRNVFDFNEGQIYSE